MVLILGGHDVATLDWLEITMKDLVKVAIAWLLLLELYAKSFGPL